jgi:16S rRNA processing protein RimM
MTEENAKYIVIGKIGATYGVHGWLKIHAFTAFTSNILEYSPWYIGEADNQHLQEITIEEGKTHGNGVIVKFANANNPEDARLYTGKTIHIKRTQLPPLQKDEYYWSDLEGLTVINQHGETLGKVTSLMETGSNDVLIVKGEVNHAIPYLPGSVVLSIDLAKKEMLVNWDPV